MRLKEIISKFFSFKKYTREPSNLNSGKSPREKYKDLGVFQLDEESFTIQFNDYYKKLYWADITQINTYKKDLLATDLVVIELVYDDRAITIHEELPGWWQFTLRMLAKFLSIPENWFGEVVKPPFAPNWTTLYEKATSILDR